MANVDNFIVCYSYYDLLTKLVESQFMGRNKRPRHTREPEERLVKHGPSQISSRTLPPNCDSFASRLSRLPADFDTGRSGTTLVYRRCGNGHENSGRETDRVCAKHNKLHATTILFANGSFSPSPTQSQDPASVPVPNRCPTSMAIPNMTSSILPELFRRHVTVAEDQEAFLLY